MSKANKQHKQQMPKIRFKGFNSECITMPISEAVREVKRPLSMNDATEYQLITVKRRNEGIVSRGGYKGSEVLVKSQFIVEENDFIISKRQVVHGATGLLPKVLTGSIVSNEYLVLEGSSKLDINYFALNASLPQMRHKFYLSSYGIDIEKLFFDVKDWYRRTITLPDLKEQTQIGNFFQQLDKLIELQTRAVESAEMYKKAMLQKMFPQKGEKVPRVRFEGFSGDWNVTNLGSIGKVKSGVGFPEAEQNSVGEIPFFKVSDMNLPGNENVMLNANNYVNQTQIISNKWKVIDDIPSIIFAKVGAAIFLNRKRLVNIPFLIDNNMMAYSFDKTWDQNFVKTLFDTLFLPRFAQVGALPSMNGGDITSIKVLLPFKEEQMAIGSFFQKLDQNIEFEKKKLEQYQTMKRALLQRMFV